MLDDAWSSHLGLVAASRSAASIARSVLPRSASLLHCFPGRRPGAVAHTQSSAPAERVVSLRFVRLAFSPRPSDALGLLAERKRGRLFHVAD